MSEPRKKWRNSAAVHKRKNFLQQLCITTMREKHPQEYDELLKETVRLFPERARPRFLTIV